MPDEIRINRAAPALAQGPAPSDEGPGGGSKTPWLVLGLVVIVIIVLGVLLRGKLFKGSGQQKTAGGQPAATAKPSGYQAVFLTNGQVYFGKISNAQSTYATLTDIFYLQVVQPPLQGQQQPGQQPAAPQPQISLVKLGNELHGPVDEMQINRDHVLFYEDLKEDGQVVQAIKNFKANPPAVQPQQ